LKKLRGKRGEGDRSPVLLTRCKKKRGRERPGGGPGCLLQRVQGKSTLPCQVSVREKNHSGNWRVTPLTQRTPLKEHQERDRPTRLVERESDRRRQMTLRIISNLSDGPPTRTGGPNGGSQREEKKGSRDHSPREGPKNEQRLGGLRSSTTRRADSAHE